MMDRKKLATSAVKEAERLRIKAKVPPSNSVDPVDVAVEVCRCRVQFQPVSSLEGMYSPTPRPTIIIGSERPPGRQHYTCAHELGHHIFGHGACIDELGSAPGNKSEELLAEMFAGYFLMPKLAVTKALAQRGYTAGSLTPEQVFRIACYFGVGYSTILTHMHHSLATISYSEMKDLQGVQPKVIKASYEVTPQTSMILADRFWIGRAINLEVGDALLIPVGCELESSKCMRVVGELRGFLKCEAVAPGYSRAFEAPSGWAIHVRVSRKNYQGLSRYRFLEEVEE